MASTMSNSTILTMRHTLQTESHVGLTRAHAARAIALLERPGSQAEGQAGSQTHEQADIEEQGILLGSCLAAISHRAWNVQRRRRRLPGLVLRRRGHTVAAAAMIPTYYECHSIPHQYQ